MNTHGAGHGLRRAEFLRGVASGGFMVALLGGGRSAFGQTAGYPVSTPQNDIGSLARDVYQYAYPIVLMDITRQQATAVPNATTTVGRAPINQFAHFRRYPDANARDVVRFNFDTLYSFAWLDLSHEPIILSVPDTGGRYYLVPTLDMWSDVFSSLGARTTGTNTGHFAYVAPGWRGNLPAGVARIEAPTSTIWMMGRIQTNGEATTTTFTRFKTASN